MDRDWIPFSVSAYERLARENKLPKLVNPDNFNVLTQWQESHRHLNPTEFARVLASRFLPKLESGLMPVGNPHAYLGEVQAIHHTEWFKLAALLHQAVKETLLLLRRHERYLTAYQTFAKDYADTCFLLYGFFSGMEIGESFWANLEQQSLSHGVILDNLAKKAWQYENLYKEYDSLYRVSQTGGQMQKFTEEQGQRMERIKRLEALFNGQT